MPYYLGFCYACHGNGQYSTTLRSICAQGVSGESGSAGVGYRKLEYYERTVYWVYESSPFTLGCYG